MFVEWGIPDTKWGTQKVDSEVKTFRRQRHRQFFNTADSNEVLLWQKHQDMCLVWNLNLGRASHLTSDLGKTNAFAMLMNVSVENSSTFFAREERSSTLVQGKSNFRGNWFNSIIVW